MIRKTPSQDIAAAAVAAPLAVAAPASATDTKPTLLGAVAPSLSHDPGGAGTDRNSYDFDILATGARGHRARKTLANDSDGDKLTAFLPNDRAFEALLARSWP